MIHLRSLCLAGLLFLLGACGGDRSMEDAASDVQPGETSRSDSPGAATGSAGSTDSAQPRVPAFVTDSTTAGDSVSASGSPSAIRSVYTSLATADCRLVKRDPDTNDPTYRCPGTAGYALLVHDWDARMTVDVVAPGGRTQPLRYSGVISSAFSSLGPRAEWRMRDGKPIGLIVRVNAFENPDTPDRATSYLAVARITPGEVCVTDRIPPAANANDAARQAADQSASRPCMRDLGSR
jgi:hypothetical protein